MALTLSISPGFDGVNPIASDQITYIANVTNSGATAVTLSSLQAYAQGGAFVGAMQYLQPNVPVGVGNPVLLPGTTYSYPFLVEFISPSFAGPSPQAPGGASGVGIAANPSNQYVILTINSLSSDSTVATASLTVPVLSAIAPFPIAQGGGMQFSSGFNAVNFLTSFA